MLERMAATVIPDVPASVEQCCYCWYKLHGDGKPYPAEWSSTICSPHTDLIVKQLADSREARRKARVAA